MWSTTLFPSDYMMIIRDVHFDNKLRLCIENDEERIPTIYMIFISVLYKKYSCTCIHIINHVGYHMLNTKSMTHFY